MCTLIQSNKPENKKFQKFTCKPQLEFYLCSSTGMTSLAGDTVWSFGAWWGGGGVRGVGRYVHSCGWRSSRGVQGFMAPWVCGGGGQWAVWPQWLGEYLRLAVDLVRNSAARKVLISIFQEFSVSIDKAFILAGDCALGYHSMGFRQFPDVS